MSLPQWVSLLVLFIRKANCYKQFIYLQRCIHLISVEQSHLKDCISWKLTALIITSHFLRETRKVRWICTYLLTHWGRTTHICVSKLTIIASDNALSPGRRQAIIWNNAGILSIGLLQTKFSEILIEILIFSFRKMCLKVSSAKWRPFRLGLNVLTGIIMNLMNNSNLQRNLRCNNFVNVGWTVLVNETIMWGYMQAV